MNIEKIGARIGAALIVAGILFAGDLALSQTTTKGGGGGGAGVTSISVTSANGFAGTVANPTTTPAITLSTTITGVLKGNGTAISAAVAGTDYSAGTSALATGLLKSTTSTGTLSIAASGTDYAPATSGSAILKGNGSGAFANAVSGTDYAPATSGSALLAGNGAGGFSTPTAATIGAPIIVTAPSNVTPASATPASSGMSITVTGGATYAFEIFYYLGSVSSTGSTIGINGGAVTVTSIVGNFNTNVTGATGQGGAAITTLSSTLTSTATAMVGIRATGTFVVNAGGTFIPTYATGTSATDTMLAGSWMRLTRTN